MTQQQPDTGDLELDLIGDEQAADTDQAGGDQAAGAEGQPPAWWQAASQQIIQQTQAEIDRRINQLVQRNRRGTEETQQQAGTQRQAHVGPDPADVRDARAVFREALADQGLRLSDEERQLVMPGVSALIRSELGSDADPDSAGARVAKQVATQIRGLRQHYQARTVSALEKLGALDRSKLKPGQVAETGGAQRQQRMDWAAGEAKARELMARRGIAVPEKDATK